ncbi:type IV pilus twitching motility protein PilT [Thermodesulforhabdus norvegica]|uniref:Twitching motility protein PilT n=1 Tax=Thermodesulforhabdus norvegica TaxID=39841 RepID=A0A1I4T5W3_9BACT|nr:PilT/PilU family type 4a pilus ATPase [Thermodesulforhabdus norvegica]SFM72003.1 twitching motility protein PilT [Thermodesulforhabdus norvegica]
MRREELDILLSKILDEYPTLSDINFTVGYPPQAEVDGVLKPAPLEIGIKELLPYHTEMIALALIGNNRRNLQNLLRQGSCDLSYAVPGKARFRVNVFYQKGNLSIVMRQLPPRVPTMEEMNLPRVLKKIAFEKNGIVFVTGATGSGKSTTLATILHEINRNFPVHVVTLEDPIEFVHQPIKATFNQRELGSDFDTYANGLRAALRQAPKVILVGEMRDRETMEIGLNAAETGHLVLTTLHTIDASHTISRLIGMFEYEEERLIRLRLAESMRWIVSQRLLPRVGGGRIAAFEIMGNNVRVREAIIHGEAEGKTFYDIMEQSKPFGWTSFDSYILDLYRSGEITEETAILYASNRAIVKRGIDAIKASRGERTTDIEGLQIDTDYSKKVIGS